MERRTFLLTAAAGGAAGVPTLAPGAEAARS
ncbi:twin-arginine translocation signal domain-containing protein, partial [Streptomyces tauricus]